MTDYTVDYWFKDADLERIYLNAADRTSLGYIERRQVEGQRGGYDDRHRAAKGDTTEVVSDRVTVSLPEGAYEALIAQAVSAADAAGVSHMPMTDRADEIGIYLGLKNILNGIGFMGDKKKVKKARKALAASFRFAWEGGTIISAKAIGEGSFSERIDIHGRILWLPRLAIDTAAAFRAVIESVLADCRDWDVAAQILTSYGFTLTLNVEFHRPQDYRSWTLGIKPGGWAHARLAECNDPS